MKSYYSIKQSVAIVTLCTITNFSFGQITCQEGVDYKNSCNPYKTTFINVKITKKNSQEAIASKTNRFKNLSKSYMNRLLDRYSSNYNGKYGLQSVIDRSKYKQIEAKTTKKVVIHKIAKTTKIIKNPKVINQKKGNKDTLNGIKITNQLKDAKNKEKIVAKKNIRVKSIKLSKDSHKLTKVITKEANKTTIVKHNIIKKNKIAEANNSLAKNKKAFYVVKKGDTLSGLAKKFSTTKSNLISLNELGKKPILKFGSKLVINALISKKIKSKKKLVLKTKNKKYYIVKKGDNLFSIAKKTNISITRLREINRLSRSFKIKINEKIYLKPNKIAIKRKTFNYKKDIKFKKVLSLKHKKRIRVVATAYTSHRNQTDRTPFLAAWNNRIRPGMKIIAVSQDLIRKYGLTNGVRVKIMGLRGYYVVRDKMNARLRNHIDIYMGVNKRRALRWGRRRITLYW